MIDRLEFYNFEDFIKKIDETLDHVYKFDSFASVSIIAKPEKAKILVQELIYDGYEIAHVEITSNKYSDYNDEYVISIDRLGGFAEVWCEKFIREGSYIDDMASVVYVLDDCSSKVLSHCHSKTVIEVSFVDEDECDDVSCDCYNDDCHFDLEEDDNQHGFTQSWTDGTSYFSRSFYSTDESLTKKMLNEWKDWNGI